MYRAVFMVFVIVLLFGGCTQETQNKIGRSLQNWTGTNGVMDVYAGDKLVIRFIKVDKMSTGIGRSDGQQRAYRYSYGYLDENFNYKVDDNERKLYFEIGDYSNYVFYENPRG